MACSDKGNPSSLEAVALPLALCGLNLDLSTMNSRGVANLVANTAVATVQAEGAKPQVLILAQSGDFTTLLKTSISTLGSSMSKPVTVGAVGDKAAHIVIGSAADASKAAVESLRLVVLTEIDQLCAAHQDADAKQLLTTVKADKKCQLLVFNPELLMSEVSTSVFLTASCFFEHPWSIGNEITICGGRRMPWL